MRKKKKVQIEGPSNSWKTDAQWADLGKPIEVPLLTDPIHPMLMGNPHAIDDPLGATAGQQPH